MSDVPPPILAECEWGIKDCRASEVGSFLFCGITAVGTGVAVFMTSTRAGLKPMSPPTGSALLYRFLLLFSFL